MSRKVAGVTWLHLKKLTDLLFTHRRRVEELEKENESLCQTLEEWRADAYYYKGLVIQLDTRLKKLMGLDARLKARKKRKG